MRPTFYRYRAHLEGGDSPDVIVVTFPDVPEAITEGGTMDEARSNAADALGTALLAYIRAGRALPVASDGEGLPVTVEPDIAAKLAVLTAFRLANISQRELAARLGKDEKEVRRILDPMHITKIGALAEALRVMGHRMIVGVEPIAA